MEKLHVCKVVFGLFPCAFRDCLDFLTGKSSWELGLPPQESERKTDKVFQPCHQSISLTTNTVAFLLEPNQFFTCNTDNNQIITLRRWSKMQADKSWDGKIRSSCVNNLGWRQRLGNTWRAPKILIFQLNPHPQSDIVVNSKHYNEGRKLRPVDALKNLHVYEIVRNEEMSTRKHVIETQKSWFLSSPERLVS